MIADIGDIASSGLLSLSHRGGPIRQMVRRTVTNLRRAMSLPDDYAVLFPGSATAAMELFLANTCPGQSVHFVGGAFAQRFADTANSLGCHARLVETPLGAPFDLSDAPATAPDVVAVTHMETATTVQWPARMLADVRARYPDALLAVDVTSSFGAMAMDWTGADFWLASVQKCLGLPAGLGLAIVGPRVFARAQAIGKDRRVAGWRDLLVMRERLVGGDTFETPNVLGLALLERQSGRWDLAAVDRATREKAALVRETVPDDMFFVRDPLWRALTVHTLRVGDPAPVHARARAAGFELGLGYGPLKKDCIRLATFPSVTIRDVAAVLRTVVSDGSSVARAEELRNE